MARASEPGLREVAARLTSHPLTESEDWFEKIETQRDYMASAEAATTYGVSLDRVSLLALRASKSQRWARAIHEIVLALRPEHVLELGTAVGISASYVATALQINGGGSLSTIDIDRAALDMACDTFRRLGVESRIDVHEGEFRDVVPDLAAKLPSIDFVFKDGDHSRDATVEWFDILGDVVAPNCVFLFDDIRRNREMATAWTLIKRSPRITASLDLFGMGLVFTGSDERHMEDTEHYRFALR